MKTIKLTPKQISVLLDIDIDFVLKSIIAHFKIKLPDERIQAQKQYEKMVNIEYDCTGLKIVKQTHLNENEEMNYLQELVIQVNKYWTQVMRNVLNSGPCIKKIGFTSNFSYYDLILEDEAVYHITNKLAEYHEQKYGTKTTEYTTYKSKTIKSR